MPRLGTRNAPLEALSLGMPRLATREARFGGAILGLMSKLLASEATCNSAAEFFVPNTVAPQANYLTILREMPVLVTHTAARGSAIPGQMLLAVALPTRGGAIPGNVPLAIAVETFARCGLLWPCRPLRTTALEDQVHLPIAHVHCVFVLGLLLRHQVRNQGPPFLENFRHATLLPPVQELVHSDLLHLRHHLCAHGWLRTCLWPGWALHAEEFTMLSAHRKSLLKEGARHLEDRAWLCIFEISVTISVFRALGF